MIRVMHVTSTPRGIGGVEQLLIDAAPHYQQHQIEVSFVNLFGNLGDGILASRLRDRGATVHEIGAPRFHLVPLTAARLVRLINVTRPDVLHMHMFHATVLGIIAGKLARTPVRVVTRHYLGAGYAHRSALSRAADAMAMRSSDHVIAISRAVREDVTRRFGISESRVSVIPNGIEVERFGAAAAKPSGTSSGPVLVGSLGSLVRWKGHSVLIRAVAQLVESGLDIQLVIAGDGPERPDLEALIAALGLRERVRMIGFQADASAFLGSLDLYVHPSLDEALGLALIEAMAAGLPVIATSTGGISDVIRSPTVGVLVPPGDVRATADAIGTLVRDEPRRRALGSRARELVIGNYSVSGVVGRYAELYRQLLRSGTGHAEVTVAASEVR